eukprot:440620-Rhodomonas_salina.1
MSFTPACSGCGSLAPQDPQLEPSLSALRTCVSRLQGINAGCAWATLHRSRRTWCGSRTRLAQPRIARSATLRGLRASRIARAESEIEYFAPNPRTASAQPSERVYYRDELQISPEREIAYDELGMQQESGAPSRAASAACPPCARLTGPPADEGDMSPAAARMVRSLPAYAYLDSPCCAIGRLVCYGCVVLTGAVAGADGLEASGAQGPDGKAGGGGGDCWPRGR